MVLFSSLVGVKARERAEAENSILFSPWQAYTGSSTSDVPRTKMPGELENVHVMGISKPHGNARAHRFN
jgi:hypothetical protein